MVLEKQLFSTNSKVERLYTPFPQWVSTIYSARKLCISRLYDNRRLCVHSVEPQAKSDTMAQVSQRISKH